MLSPKELVIFNTGEKSEYDESNTSHAERQLCDWILHSVDPKWKMAIKSIKIEINWSPCRSCVNDLDHLAGILPNLISAKITFSEIYYGEKLGTRKKDLDKLRDRWIVIGPPILERIEDPRGKKSWRLTK
jgi:hypothetical protein